MIRNNERGPRRFRGPLMRASRLAIASLLALGCSRAPDPLPSSSASAPPPIASAPPPASAPSAIASAPPPEAPSQSASPDSISPLLLSAQRAIEEAVAGAIAREEIPGAVVAVVRGDRVVYERAFGYRVKAPDAVPMTLDTVFDLASLTKAVATAPSIMKLVEEGKIDLRAPVSRYLPDFGKNGKESVTVADLLLHTSGLVADNALSDYRGTRADAMARICASAPASEPGSTFVYSDVGFIVLGELVEKVSGQPLDEYARGHVFAPLGMVDTMFKPTPALAARAAPTEARDGVVLRGEVHDPRATRLGGVAGHAGLFSTARDLALFSRMLLAEGRPIFAHATLAEMTRPRELPGGIKRALGWDVESPFAGQRGELPGGYGHTGFTGTSMWIDPGSKTAVIVLASRLHPDGKGDARRVRREVANAVARGLREEQRGAKVADSAKVRTGIDVLERDGFRELSGRKIGLVTNPSGVDGVGTPTIDVLRAAPGVTLVALFSPEHGIRAAADGFVGDGKDAKSGLPVYSLYGKRTRPAAAELAGIDTLVLDLADAGVRFFTYETTLGYLLETAAEQKLRLVVLDRPNPLGGVVVEGPLLERSRTSFVGYHPLPVRHGLTLGELATLFNQERKIGADLVVVRMEGWRRAQLFDATGLAWVNPSPNLRSFGAALLYPGVALIEATNVSVGRGTARPFEQIGAPWIDGARLAAALTEQKLAGVRFEATSFTPESSAFAKERCGGVAITVTDRARLSPVRLGLAIASALAKLYPREWESKNLITLLGHEPTVQAVLRGESLEAIEAGYAPELARFVEERKRYLLYLE
jgi:uncharacterized protein YbbC (DUF1343 family)